MAKDNGMLHEGNQRWLAQFPAVKVRLQIELLGSERFLPRVEHAAPWIEVSVVVVKGKRNQAQQSSLVGEKGDATTRPRTGNVFPRRAHADCRERCHVLHHE